MINIIILLSELVINVSADNTLLFPAEQTTFYFGGGDLFTFNRSKDDHQSIYKWIPADSNKKLIWHTDHSLSSVTSSGEKFVAFIEGYDEKPGEPRLVLRILSTDTQNVKTVSSSQNIWQYTWGPGAKKIAYTRGDTWECSWRGYRSEGVFVYDIEKETTEKIAESGYSPFWANFDGKLYFMTFEPNKVWRYDFSNKSTEETPYQEMTFSPDGRYYYVAEEDLGGFHLYQRESNKAVECSPEKGISPLALIRLGPTGWIGKTRLRTMAYGAQGEMWIRGMYIVDVDTGEIRFPSRPVLCGIEPDKAIVLKADGNFAIELISNMEIVKAEDLPKNPEWEKTDKNEE